MRNQYDDRTPRPYARSPAALHAPWCIFDTWSAFALHHVPSRTSRARPAPFIHLPTRHRPLARKCSWARECCRTPPRAHTHFRAPVLPPRPAYFIILGFFAMKRGKHESGVSGPYTFNFWAPTPKILIFCMGNFAIRANIFEKKLLFWKFFDFFAEYRDKKGWRNLVPIFLNSWPKNTPFLYRSLFRSEPSLSRKNDFCENFRLFIETCPGIFLTGFGVIRVPLAENIIYPSSTIHWWARC